MVNGVFLPDTALMRFWNDSMRILGLYNFIFVPLQIATVEVQMSSTVAILDWVRAWRCLMSIRPDTF